MSNEVASAINLSVGDPDAPLLEAIEYAAVRSLGRVGDDGGSERGIVSAVEELAKAAGRIGSAITPIAAPGTDANGGHVESLTEAVMGMTGGMVKIAEAIESLAEAIREMRQ